MQSTPIRSIRWVGHPGAQISIFCLTVEAIVVLEELTVIAKSFSQKIGDYCRKKITINLILSAN